MKTTSEFTAPYPGLRPFERHEAALFFGRDEQVDQLLGKLDESHFLAVVGTSGSGKSSLVRAGLLPALEGGYLASASARWAIAEMRPGDQPFRNLANALIKDTDWGKAYAKRTAVATSGAKDEAVQNLEQDLKQGSLALNWRLGVLPLPKGSRLLVLVDQFEELFRYHPSNRHEAAAFVALLLGAASHASVYVVVTLRSEYLRSCANYPDLPEAINRGIFLIPSLTPEQMADAIQLPAELQQFGGSVELALVGRLLDEASGQMDQLPLLQHALMRLWNVVGQDKVLTLEQFEALGGLSKMIDQHVEEAFRELTSEQARIAEILFRNLTDPLSAERDTRRPARLGEIADLAGVSPNQLADVVDVFRRPGRFFLTASDRDTPTRTTILDVTHEALIRQWQRLARWTADETEQADRYMRLEAAARRHATGNGALYIDPDLDDALQWRAKDKPSPLWAARYGNDFDLAMRFLDESRDKRDGERAREQERAAAERRSKEVSERKARELRIWQMAGAIIVALLAVAIVGWSQAWIKGESLASKQEELKKNQRDLKIANTRLKIKQAQLELANIKRYWDETSDSEKAIRELERIVSLDPKNANIYCLRGQIFFSSASQARQEKPGYAEQPGAIYTDQAAKTNETAKSEAQRAKSAEEKAISNALRDLTQAINLDPDQDHCFEIRAQVYTKLGRYQDAVLDYSRAISIAPNRAELYLARGDLRASKTQDFNGSIEDYEAVIKGGSGALGYLRRARVYQQYGLRRLAIDDLTQALHYSGKEGDNDRIAQIESELRDLGATPSRTQEEAKQLIRNDVYIHFVDKNDKGIANRVRDALKVNFNVEKVAFIPDVSTNGDIRYFDMHKQEERLSDRRAANNIAKLVEKVLADAGFDIRMQTIQLDGRKWSLGRVGLFEVWIPSLSADAIHTAEPQEDGTIELLDDGTTEFLEDSVIELQDIF